MAMAGDVGGRQGPRDDRKQGADEVGGSHAPAHPPPELLAELIAGRAGVHPVKVRRPSYLFLRDIRHTWVQSGPWPSSSTRFPRASWPSTPTPTTPRSPAAAPSPGGRRAARRSTS